MPRLEEITDLPGFGPSKVENFREAGYESLEDLRGITWEELGEIKGINSSAKRKAIITLLEEEGLRDQPEKEEKYKKFRDLLEKLFQFESADLDFGVYRIMNEKRDRIEKFLDQDLQEKVEDELEEFLATEQGDAKAKLEEVEKQIKQDFPNWIDESGNINENEIPDDPQGIMKERKEEYFEAKEEAEKAEIGEETEAAIYQELYRFFKRYYKDGDFIPQRRAASQEKYAIPYNGEEVKLHWANKDQYFVKTGEHFKDYKFRKDSYDIEFKLHDAHVEKNNKKGDDKYFVLRDENPIEQDEYHLLVHFEYRPLTEDDIDRYGLSESYRTKARDIQDSIEEKILSNVGTNLRDTLSQEVEDPRSGSSVIEKHLKNYRTKNEKDYFIHKDLRGFLQQELDFYLKNEVFSLKEMTDDNGEIPAHVRARLNAIENIANEIIDFVSEIEDFQKKIYNKKKFVTETNYMAPLRIVSKDISKRILEVDQQVSFWENNNLKATEDLTDYFEDSQNNNLLFDTKLLPDKLKQDIINELDFNEIEGELIKSDNYHALQAYKEKYAGDISCIYIDPPYNTGKDGFVYKDNYQHSTWISMMVDRIELAKEFLEDDGVIFVSIDHHEKNNLRKIMDSVFGEDNLLGELVWNLGTGTTAGHFRRSHEYIIAYSKNKEALDNFDYEGEDKTITHGALKKISEKNPPSEITFPAGTEFEGEDAVFEGEIGGSEKQIIKDEKMEFEDGRLKEDTTIEAGWAMKTQIEQWIETGEATDTKGQPIIRFYFNKNGILTYEKKKTKINPKTVLSEYGSTKNANNEIENIIGENEVDYPKPTDLIQFLIGLCTNEGDIIMDFFAGSGTTGHATINLNRDSEENRNYILVEMGDFFNSTLKPRLIKADYAANWEDEYPKQINPNSGIIKYHKFEQFEDSLHQKNLKINETQAKMGNFTSDHLQYFLNFGVDGPSLLDLHGLKNPFNYKMYMHEGDETKRKTIDLVGTFNYLIGLAVEKTQRYKKLDREYRVVKGVSDGEEVAVVWRNIEDEDDMDFFEQEREFLNSEVLDGEDVVYINHDSALQDAKSIEKTFQKRMWE